MLLPPQDPANVDPAEHEPAPAVTPHSQSGWRSAWRRKPRSRVMVLDRESGTTRPIVEVPPLVSSTPAARQGFLVERMNVGSFKQQDIINLTHLVVLQVEGTAKLAWRTDGPLQDSLVHPGQISLVPAHLQHSVFSECLGEYVAVSLEPGFFLSAAAETGKLDAAEIPLLYGAEDPLLRELVCSLAKVLCPPAPAEDLYAESLANDQSPNHLEPWLQSIPFRFRPSHPGFRAADETGTHALGSLRLQIGGGYRGGLVEGGSFHVIDQLALAAPDVDLLISVPEEYLEVTRWLAEHRWPRPGRVTLVLEPDAIAPWTQDNGKAGVVIEPGPCSRPKTVPVFVPS